MYLIALLYCITLYLSFISVFSNLSSSAPEYLCFIEIFMHS